MKFEPITLEIDAVTERVKPEVRLMFSRNVREVRMTANEAERHAYEMLDAVRVIRKIESTE